MKVIDMRSDTVTQPTVEMRRFMAEATVGDDVYQEDPSVVELERLSAQLLGYEAGLFVSSGTMGNLVALLSHCQRGQEIIVESQAHIYYYEVGGFAALGGLSVVTIPGDPRCQGYMDPDAIARAIRSSNVHYPVTGLLCLENSHNLGGGAAVTPQQTKAMLAVTKEQGIPSHLDGARVFNSAAALGLPIDKVVAGIDSVQFCLSKGLGAPVGSVLVGSEEFIFHARRFRKMVGGGMRQAGIIAAAGIYALQNHVERLVDDNRRAAQIAATLSTKSGMKVVAPEVPTNIVLVNTEGTGHEADSWVRALDSKGIVCGAMGQHLVRLVTHLDVTQDDVDYVCECLAQLDVKQAFDTEKGK